MRISRSLLCSAALCAGLFQVWGGPPLICFPFDIGNAQSLPWGTSASRGWENTDPNYDTKRLAADTLRILDSDASVLVRMETVRRAVIYGAGDHSAATTLLNALRERASAPGAGAPALFNYGYAIETMKQMKWKYNEDLTGGVDGYPLISKALAIEPGNAEMHFAAAIVASYPRRPDYNEHVAKALAAKSDALLAANAPAHLK